ncbi:hypothetical protein RCL1_006342 [Eukaryota sp. TZLM3-RCL]
MSTLADRNPSLRKSARIAEQQSRSRQRREIQSEEARISNRRTFVRQRRHSGGAALPTSQKAQEAALLKAQQEAIASVKKLEALTKQLGKKVASPISPVRGARGGRRPQGQAFQTRGRRQNGPRRFSRAPNRPVKAAESSKTAEELNAELAAHMSL